MRTFSGTSQSSLATPNFEVTSELRNCSWLFWSVIFRITVAFSQARPSKPKTHTRPHTPLSLGVTVRFSPIQAETHSANMYRFAWLIESLVRIEVEMGRLLPSDASSFSSL